MKLKTCNNRNWKLIYKKRKIKQKRVRNLPWTNRDTTVVEKTEKEVHEKTVYEMEVHKMEVQQQRRRRRDSGWRSVVAAIEEGGGSDGGKEKDERVTRRWREVHHIGGLRPRSPLRGCSGRRWSEVVGDSGGRGCSKERFAKLNPNGFSFFKNRSIYPFLAPVTCHLRPNT